MLVNYHSNQVDVMSEVVGGRTFCYHSCRISRTAVIFAVGSVGPRMCFSASMSSTGVIKPESIGNWKFTLEQYEFVQSKTIELLGEFL